MQTKEPKYFRIRANEEKIKFIIEKTDISAEIILKAQKVAVQNPYHGFGHELGVTESGIMIAEACGCNRYDINTIALALLFHDADHRGIHNPEDEERAAIAMMSSLSKKDLKICGVSPILAQQRIRDFILSTRFSVHGKSGDLGVCIVQDADIASIGRGPEYWLWATMGLVDEFNNQHEKPITPFNFIHTEQVKFLEVLESSSINGEIFLTSGARKIFYDPYESLEIMLSWPEEAIDWAYSVRFEDLTFEEFQEGLNKII
ncbi:HD domain-containing protein [Candidatus Nomurabacteria bacterium]|nr:MAG: HD domain-containing protein [Candidatus Nomurabacteria bacterium]